MQLTADVGHLITLHSFGDMPAEMVEASMRLFAREVLPVVRTFGGPDEPWSVPYETLLKAR